MNALAALEQKVDQTAAHAQSRSVRVIHRDSFGFADRGDEWSWSASATWWHQRRGMKAFHKRILFGLCSKSEYPTPPTVDEIAAIYNDSTNHIWEISV